MALSSPSLEEESLGRAYDGRLIRRLLPYLRPYAASVSVAMVLLTLLTLLELAGPLIVKQAIDDAIANQAIDRLSRYATAYFGVVLGVFVLRWGQNYLLNTAGQQAMHDLRVA